MAWRVFPWDPAAKPGEPFSPSYVYPNQGSGRFDLSGKLVVYLAESAVHAVAEKLQHLLGDHGSEPPPEAAQPHGQAPLR